MPPSCASGGCKECDLRDNFFALQNQGIYYYVVNNSENSQLNVHPNCSCGLTGVIPKFRFSCPKSRSDPGLLAMVQLMHNPQIYIRKGVSPENQRFVYDGMGKDITFPTIPTILN